MQFEIEQLLAEWAWLIDHGRADEAACLYTPDAEQVIGGVSAVGLEAITDGLRRRAGLTQRTSRHVISNLKLSVTSASIAEGAWILTLYRSDDSVRPAKPILVADVDDRYQRLSGRWKFRSRRITPIFTDP
jgi:SnoaL-like protein